MPYQLQRLAIKFYPITALVMAVFTPWLIVKSIREQRAMTAATKGR